MLNGKKGQTSLEIILMLLFLLIFIVFTLYPTAEYAIKQSIDFNNLALAKHSGMIIADAVRGVSLSGVGVKKDIIIHIPFDTVNIECGGRNITFYVQLWRDEEATSAISYKTAEGFSVVKVSTELPASVSSNCSLHLCPTKSGVRSVVWGSNTKFCSTAGFNMDLYVEKDSNNLISIKQRAYWASTEWILKY